MAPTDEPRGIIIVGGPKYCDEMERALATLTATGGYTVLDHPTPSMNLTPTSPTINGVIQTFGSMTSQFPDKKTRWGRSEMRKMAKETKSMHKSAMTCMKNRTKRKKKKR
jgi:hypothetical protein